MDELFGQVELLAATFVYCVGSGFIPVLNAEAYLIAVAATSDRAVFLGVATAATVGQMVAKSVMYLVGRGVVELPLGRYRDRLETAGEKLEKSRLGTELFIFVSALVGFPPFYLISVVCGTLKIPFWIFLLSGTAGRLIRFALVLYSPQLILDLI